MTVRKLHLKLNKIIAKAYLTPFQMTLNIPDTVITKLYENLRERNKTSAALVLGRSAFVCSFHKKVNKVVSAAD